MRLDTMMDSCDRLRRRGGWAEDALAQRCSFPIGPWNTWSNLAYFLAGAWVVYQDASLSGWVMGWALGTLGMGSLLYHGYKSVEWNKLDRAGMYFVFGAMCIHALPAHPWTPWFMLGTGLLLAVLFAYVLNNIDLDVQMGVLFYYSLVAGVMFGDRTGAMIAFAVFLLGFVCWQLDKRTLWLGRFGHALWHILTALAIAVMYGAQ